MNFLIITIHCIPNFGSVFQSYGLVDYLKKQGYEAKIIDYRPRYYIAGRNAWKGYISKIIYCLPYFNQMRKYRNFIEKYLPTTLKTYHTYDSLKELQRENAVFVSGGDQIWNSFHKSGNDDSYKLTFVNNKNKIAYGTSMGRSNYSIKELQIISEKIKDFISIGLREQSTVPMLQSVTDVPVYHAADPVLLKSKNEYLEIIGSKKIIKDRYLLMYLARKSTLLDKTIETVAKNRGLKVVHVCGFKKKCKCDYHLKSTGPEELLNILFYADFVVSGSFHATLFSILLHKQFCTLLPEEGTNTRIEDSLEYFGLSNRIIRSEHDIQGLKKDIDFRESDKQLDYLVENSKKHLNEVINKISRL